MASEPYVQLRPLGIGEIFDRAITLYIKNFVTFTLIVLTVIAPYGVVQYFVAPDQTSEIQQIVQVITNSEGPVKSRSKMPDPLAGYSGEKMAALFAVGILALLLVPFSSNAVAVAVAAVYAGKRPEYAASYAKVFRRWLPILGVTLLAGAMLVLAYVGFALLIVLDVIAATVLVRASVVLAIVLALIGVVLFLAFLAAVIVFFLIATFSFYAVVIEETRPMRAIGESFGRLMNRREIGKALLMALSMFAVQIGIFSITGTIGIVLLVLTRSTIPQIVVGSLVNAALSAFLTVLLSVYYYDVRTRREGLDLEVELTQLAGS